ncbi:helix-turn-helix transcriptional regulator [Mesorhizobium kowhaii]|uniref:helix-turn-helix transcriptional regulator n=1 Tax=Mesorhizobium kowhaii TaxID=1300272 RepID=UPI0035E66B32
MIDLVDEQTACRIIGGESNPIHRSTLWRGINSGRYPRPLKMNQSTNRWRRDELIAVIERAVAERDEQAA